MPSNNSTNQQFGNSAMQTPMRNPVSGTAPQANQSQVNPLPVQQNNSSSQTQPTPITQNNPQLRPQVTSNSIPNQQLHFAVPSNNQPQPAVKPTQQPINQVPNSNQHIGVATPTQPIQNVTPINNIQRIPQPGATTPSQQRPQVPQTNQNPVNVTQHPTQAQPSPQKFINPSNFQQPTPTNSIKPQSTAEVKQMAMDANILREGLKPNYDHLDQAGRTIQINTFEVLKLCIYLIPGLPIFLLVLRSIKDPEVMWHSRQSLVAQAIWLIVLTIMNLVNLPLVSGNGFSLALVWNIVLYGALIWAGVQAYLGKRWRIPVIAEIGTVFIDGQK